MDPGVETLAAAAGAAWGFAGDRIGARWPAHGDGSVRATDWRTIAVIAVGAASFAMLVFRYGDRPMTLLLLTPLVAALVVLFATDLDQRLLPDVLTLPIAGYAVAAFVSGLGPFVRTPGELGLAAVAAVGIPGVLYLVSIPFGAGAIGIGDLKLLFGVGLLVGVARLFATVVIGAVSAAAGIVILIALHRITLKSYVPYGPFLIVGAIWAITVTTAP